MKLITNYTKEKFKSDKFQMALNNTHYVRSALLSESVYFSNEINENHLSINVPIDKCVDILGDSNFQYGENNFWIFEYNSNTFYYECRRESMDFYDGSVGIKISDNHREFDNSLNSIEGNLMIEFLSEMSKLLNK